MGVGADRLCCVVLTDASSLLKYHHLSVHILACCCTGQNPRNKAKLAELIPFHTVVSNILCCHLKDDGKKF